MTKSRMRAVLLLALIIFLARCLSVDDDLPEPKPRPSASVRTPTPTVTRPTPTPVRMGEAAISTDGYGLKATLVIHTPNEPLRYITPTLIRDHRVDVMVTITNFSGLPLQVSDAWVDGWLVDDTGQNHPDENHVAKWAVEDKKNGVYEISRLSRATLERGENTRGRFIFSIPDTATPVRLKVYLHDDYHHRLVPLETRLNP